MDLQLTGKRALVTGASMGIGNAIARALAAEGCRLCVTARRVELLEELGAKIVAAGGQKPEIVVCDMLEEGAAETLAAHSLARLGGMDILVNSAGGSTGPVSIDAAEQVWEESMTLNFTRVRQLTHALLPSMMATGWGRVITISGKSEPGWLAAAHGPKAAIHAWSKGLSRVVGPKGVTVNCIAPGRIMSEQIRRNYTEEFRAKQAAEEIPAGRYGEPEELAVAATFLASPLAGYITGAVIPVDGGLRRYAY